MIERIPQEEVDKIRKIVLSLNDNLEPKKRQILKFLDKVDKLLGGIPQKGENYIKLYRVMNGDAILQQMEEKGINLQDIANIIGYNAEYTKTMIKGKVRANIALQEYLKNNNYKVKYVIRQKGYVDRIVEK